MPEAHADDDRPAAPTPEPGAAPVPGPAERPVPASADEAASEGADAPPAVPSEEELVRTATPATVRRAPRYRAFATAGALLGALLGLVLALVLGPDRGTAGTDVGVLPFLDGQNTVRLLAALAGAVLGLLVGAVLALAADRRSTRGRR
ncbi:histidine kinase [Cellulomonas telluris]|uniref:histidine kinase n=1 Tax=Cellulomonas telluris TaxID=2306636 RepID=UPI001FE4DDF8|nr:histidine kinase [Cellulomonas telluris]